MKTAAIRYLVSVCNTDTEKENAEYPALIFTDDVPYRVV